MLTRTRLITCAVAAAALALPAAAAADSIVYIDQGNVWTMQPDGSGKVQLTGGGGWHSPTQADDGTIAAVQGAGPIQVMAKDGRPLRTITTEGARSSNGGGFDPRPIDLSFSPDGSKIAYVYTNSTCPPASSCGAIQRSTFYTRADVTQATPQTQWGNQFGVGDPEWITNDRALVFGGFGSQVSVDDIGGGDYSFEAWMTPNADQGDGELSRDGRKLATTFFYGQDKILAFFAVTGDLKSGPPPADPVAACNTEAPDMAYADPTWSPDSAGLAYQSSKGIYALRFTKLDESGCATGGDGRVLTATGSQPDWGPAEPATARWQAPAAPQPQQPAAAPVAAKVAPVKPGSALAVSVDGAARQAFRGRLSVVCTAPGAKACAATGAVKVGSRTYRAKASGAPGRRLTLRFAPKGAKAIRKALRGRKALTASVVLTATAADGSTSEARRTIRLTR